MLEVLTGYLPLAHSSTETGEDIRCRLETRRAAATPGR